MPCKANSACRQPYPAWEAGSNEETCKGLTVSFFPKGTDFPMSQR